MAEKNVFFKGLNRYSTLFKTLWIGLAVMVLIAGPVGAQTPPPELFFADFAEDTPETPPDQANVAIGTISTVVPVSGGALFVTTDGQGSPFFSQSLRLMRNLWVPGDTPIFRAYPEGQPFSNGVYEISWRSYAGQDWEIGGFFSVSGISGTLFTIHYGDDGYFHYADGTTGPQGGPFASEALDDTPGDVGAYQPFAVKNFLVKVDLDNDVYDVYINGTRVITAHSFMSSTPDFSHFHFEATGYKEGNETTTVFGLDDLLIQDLQSIPPPACVEDQVQTIATGWTDMGGNPFVAWQSFTPQSPVLSSVELKMRLGSSFPKTEDYITFIDIIEGLPNQLDLALLPSNFVAVIPAGTGNPGEEMWLRFEINRPPNPRVLIANHTYSIKWRGGGGCFGPGLDG